MEYKIILNNLLKDLRNIIEEDEDDEDKIKYIKSTLEHHRQSIRKHEIIEEFEYELDRILSGKSIDDYFDFSTKANFVKSVSTYSHLKFLNDYWLHMDEVIQVLSAESQDMLNDYKINEMLED